MRLQRRIRRMNLGNAPTMDLSCQIRFIFRKYPFDGSRGECWWYAHPMLVLLLEASFEKVGAAKPKFDPADFLGQVGSEFGLDESDGL